MALGTIDLSIDVPIIAIIHVICSQFSILFLSFSASLYLCSRPTQIVFGSSWQHSELEFAVLN